MLERRRGRRTALIQVETVANPSAVEEHRGRQIPPKYSAFRSPPGRPRTSSCSTTWRRASSPRRSRRATTNSRRTEMVDRASWNKAGAGRPALRLMPEEYGGAGGTFAHESVINRGDRAMRRSTASASPLHNSHRRALHPPLRLRGAEEEVAAEARDRRADRRHRHDRARHRLRPAGRARPRAKKSGNHYVLNGSKTFITNGQHANLIIVVAKTDPSAGAKGTSLMVVETDERRASAAAASSTRSGWMGRHLGAVLRRRARAGRTCSATRKGQGFVQLMQQLPQERLHRLHRRHRHDRARAGADHRLRQGAQGVRQGDHRFPEHPVQARRVQDRGDHRPRLPRPLRRAPPRRRARSRHRLDGQVLAHRPAGQDRRPMPAIVRRLWLHERISDRAHVPRRPRAAHLRRHQRDHEAADRERIAS